MAKSHKPSRDITAEKKAGTLKSGVAVDKKKNKVKRKESFSLYIHKVLKQGHSLNPMGLLLCKSVINQSTDAVVVYFIVSLVEV